MRIALISDIHGNNIALDAILADIATQEVDQIICLGDVASLGPEPQQVLARLRALNCPCLMGNHDEDLIRPELAPAPGTRLGDLTAWCTEQLTEEDLAFLQSFQKILKISLEEGKTMLCCHATPRSNNEFLLATTPHEEIDAMLAGHKADVIAFGHNHTQIMRLHYKTILVSCGSVGYPIIQPWPPGQLASLHSWSEYAIVDSRGERISVELYRIPVDINAIKEAVHNSTMPDIGTFLEMWPAD